MNEKNLVCSVCGGLHPRGHRDKELGQKLEAVKKWAEKHGMNKDPKMSGGYHFVTLYPSHIEEFWKIIRVEDKQ